MTCRKGSTKLPVESFSRPCTKSPDSYLNDDSASHNLEHFLSAGVRKRHNVLTIFHKWMYEKCNFGKLRIRQAYRVAYLLFLHCYLRRQNSHRFASVS